MTPAEKELVGPARIWDARERFIDGFLSKHVTDQTRLLDIGCGVLRGMLRIINLVDQYVGVEPAGQAFEVARRRIGQAGMLHNLCVADMDGTDLFDVCWAHSVLIHMTDQVLADSLQAISRLLCRDGVFFFNATIGEGSDGSWRQYPHVIRPQSFYWQEFGKVGMQIRCLGSVVECGAEPIGCDISDNLTMMFCAKHIVA